MEKVKEEVNKIINRTFVGEVYALQDGISFDKIPYALLTTRVAWYKVWVIYCIKSTEENQKKDCVIVHTSQFLTSTGAEEFLKQCKEELKIGINSCLFNPEQKLEKLPPEALENPDVYIKPGDIIQTTFGKFFTHAGVYIGNKEVVHISGHNDKNSASLARIGQLCKDFVDKKGNLWILKPRLRFRCPEQIVKIAKQCADKGFRKGKYWITTKNCQHFTMFCAFGFWYSEEATPIVDHVVFPLQLMDISMESEDSQEQKTVLQAHLYLENYEKLLQEDQQRAQEEQKETRFH